MNRIRQQNVQEDACVDSANHLGSRVVAPHITHKVIGDYRRILSEVSDKLIELGWHRSLLLLLIESLNSSCNIKHDRGKNTHGRVGDAEAELVDMMVLVTGTTLTGDQEGVDAMSNSDLILETKGLTKKFRGGYANRDISIHVKRNSIYGLLGPNGSGKSTFLKQVTGLLKPTQGAIHFHGHPWERKDLEKIGALIESPAIYPNLTAPKEHVVARADKSPKNKSTRVSASMVKSLGSEPPSKNLQSPALFSSSAQSDVTTAMIKGNATATVSKNPLTLVISSHGEKE
jgi:hypothetical protein